MGVKAVFGTVVVVAVVVGGAAAADVVLKSRTEEQLAGELQQQIPGLDSEPDVTIHGFPFLLQVARGELDRVDVAAPTATVEGLPLEQVDVRLTGVSTDQPTTARDAHMTALAPLDGLAEAIEMDVDLAVDGEVLVASVTVLGLPLELVLDPEAAGRDIRIGVREVRAAGASIEPGSIPLLGDQLDGLTVPVDGLPEGLELTDLAVESDGVRLQAEGTDVVLEPVEAGAG